MDIGHVKLFRKLKTCATIEDDMKALGFFSWLLVHVNWKYGQWKGIDVYPGDMITSIKKLSGRINEKEKVTRRLIKVLQTEGILEVIPRANKWTRLRFCNWGTYQQLPCTIGRTDGQTKVYTKGVQLKNKEINNNNKGFGSFENVFLSKEEIKNLKTGDANFKGYISDENLWLAVERFSYYINDTGKVYDNFVIPLKGWIYKDIMPKIKEKGVCVHDWPK